MRPYPFLDHSAGFGFLSPLFLATRRPPGLPSRLPLSYSHACAAPSDAYPLYSAGIPFPPFPRHPSAFLVGASPLIVRVWFPHPFPVIPPSAQSSVWTYRTFPFVSFRTLDISCRF